MAGLVGGLGNRLAALVPAAQMLRRGPECAVQDAPCAKPDRLWPSRLSD
jgi:hypothetical protein